jgi:hypothetical protein
VAHLNRDAADLTDQLAESVRRLESGETIADLARARRAQLTAAPLQETRADVLADVLEIIRYRMTRAGLALPAADSAAREAAQDLVLKGRLAL